MNEQTYTRADMARAWDEGFEEAADCEHAGEYLANPYEQEEA